MRNIIISILFIIIFVGCRSSENCIPWNHDEIISEFQAFRSNDNFVLSIKLNAKNEPNPEFDDFIDSIEEAFVLIKHDGIILDTAFFRGIYPSGIADRKGVASVTAYGTAEWENKSGFAADRLSFTYKIHTKERCFYKNKSNFDIEKDDNRKALELYPSVNKTSDSTATFVLYAKRDHIKENEYIPTSEKMRVLIFSEKGKMVYNSSFGKNFLQVISPVLPEKVGEIYKYELKWDGVDTNGKRLPTGTYRVEMIIPANPQKYSKSIELKWKR